ncbi:MAG: hypothetical protein WBX19_16970, partial [Terracidiphilus sp.]
RNVHGALDGVSVAGPGSKIAVAAEAAHLPAVGRHEDRVVLLDAGAPPGDPTVNAGGTVIVDGRVAGRPRRAG